MSYVAAMAFLSKDKYYKNYSNTFVTVDIWKIIQKQIPFDDKKVARHTDLNFKQLL